MKNIFSIGDKKEYKHIVQQTDVAAFHGEGVHDVYATFALARDVEWTTRQFVLDMRDEDEEGIGTFLSIEHKSPAFVGEEIKYSAEVHQINGHELICLYEAKVGARVIATGKTGQKILKKDKINKLFSKSVDSM
jgi:fluoroacetyl-CoA thioesterase